MNRDEFEGKTQTLQGRIKQAAADLTGNPALHDDGVLDETAGQTEDAAGRIRRKVGEAIEEIGDAVKK